MVYWSRKSIVGKDYFDTAGIPILVGRAFREEDETDDSRVVIVSQKLVQDVWREGDSLGRTIEISNDQVSGAHITMQDHHVFAYSLNGMSQSTPD